MRYIADHLWMASSCNSNSNSAMRSWYQRGTRPGGVLVLSRSMRESLRVEMRLLPWFRSGNRVCVRNSFWQRVRDSWCHIRVSFLFGADLSGENQLKYFAVSTLSIADLDNRTISSLMRSPACANFNLQFCRNDSDGSLLGSVHQNTICAIIQGCQFQRKILESVKSREICVVWKIVQTWTLRVSCYFTGFVALAMLGLDGVLCFLLMKPWCVVAAVKWLTGNSWQERHV